MLKNLPAMQETRVRSLGREDPLEKGMATHSSILAWRIPMDRGYSPWGCKELDTTEPPVFSRFCQTSSILACGSFEEPSVSLVKGCKTSLTLLLLLSLTFFVLQATDLEPPVTLSTCCQTICIVHHCI